MGQILHRSATTAEAIRRAIQHSQESLRALSRRHGINPKTVAKWRKRSSTADHRTGPTVPRSTVLSIEQEAVIVAFRKHTLLPLDDCLYALQATIPPLTRSSLHRCLERHGISRLQEVEGDKPRKKKFDIYPIGIRGDFVDFLKEVVSHCPPEQQIHIILDNLPAYKTALAQEFLEQNPRVRFHFPPTYSSWLNQIELWFAKIEREVIARGVFTSVPDLARKLRRYINAYSANAQPIQ